MQPQTSTPPASPTVEAIANAYLVAARGDAGLALRRIILDALTDLCEAERRTLRRDRLISHGYVRGGLDRGAAADDQSGLAPSAAFVSSTSGATCP
ncbi:hypothetical protein [Methylobacterium trifolii]|uniref:Transposase n=1 Tax=Methylobacterium trifolii TaxID=1003092 RepID=A0ABQ4TYQ8_9HYPH|nr:hypothetical protein [Methylobacterium trifolii]GJE58730.1 hypothetical protein MPOCJGCO_0813 [Methylobacterium trifolii]